MLRGDYDKWLNGHYEKLVNWTKATYMIGGDEARDLVHDGLVRCLESEGLEGVTEKTAWTWTTMRIASRDFVKKRAADRYRAAKYDVATLTRRSGVTTIRG